MYLHSVEQFSLPDRLYSPPLADKQPRRNRQAAKAFRLLCRFWQAAARRGQLERQSHRIAGKNPFRRCQIHTVYLCRFLPAGYFHSAPRLRCKDRLRRNHPTRPAQVGHLLRKKTPDNFRPAAQVCSQHHKHCINMAHPECLVIDCSRSHLQRSVWLEHWKTNKRDYSKYTDPPAAKYQRDSDMVSGSSTAPLGVRLYPPRKRYRSSSLQHSARCSVRHHAHRKQSGKFEEANIRKLLLFSYRSPIYRVWAHGNPCAPTVIVPVCLVKTHSNVIQPVET